MNFKNRHYKPATVELTFKAVYDQALRMLARRAHGEQELATKLMAKGGEAEMVGQVVDRCRELGYLDDKTLAEDFARYRMQSSQHGPWRVRADLQRKGLPDEIIQEAIATSTEETDLVESARSALLRRFGSPPPPDREDPSQRLEVQKALRRQYDFLARRGFSSDTIRQALNRDFTD